ncbi:MAG: PAS domain S-box protein [Desulfomonile tiedjei]|nr:PAS domain S-box protein [Desulfomonile tiedjei]
MKTEYRILALAVFFFVFVCGADAALEHFFLEEKSFWGALIFDVCPHVIFHRSLIAISFVVFGAIAAGAIAKRKRAEEAYHESEQRYRALFEHAGDSIYLLEAEGKNAGKIISANQAAADMHGYTLDELMSMNIGDLDTPEAAQAVPRRLERLLRGERIREEVTHRRKDGQVFPLEINSGLIELGDRKYILAIDRDITQQKKAENRILEQRKFLNDLLESVTHPFYVIDPKDYRVIMSNSAARRVFASKGTACYALTHGREEPCNTSKHPCPLEIVKKTGKPATVEHVHYNGNGEAKNVELHAYPVFDGTGEVTHVIEYAIDITERRATEEERLRLVTAIEQSVETVMITDNHGIIEYVNPAFEKISGYTKEEVLGKNPKFLKGTENDALVYQRVLATITSGKPWKGRMISKSKDGRLYHEDMTISPVRNSAGLIVKYVAIGNDVTRQMELEQQLVQAQRMEAVGTLAGGIAHDFNNVLTVILGFAELLLMDKSREDPDTADLRKIVQSAKSGADLVRRLLTFSRRIETKPRPLDLNHEVKQAESLLRRTIPKMIEIELVLEEDLGTVNADPGQMEQILLNLAVNAKDAMPNGGRLTISTGNVFLDEQYCLDHFQCQSGNYVLLTVSDTGHGMSTEVVSHIFEPFYTTKKPGEGTGLGLAMVFGIVENHGGHIQCHSERGLGTNFKIFLPAMASHDEFNPADTAEMPAFGTETILLADDEEFIMELGKKILSRAGYTVLTATNGLEALRIYERNGKEIALVILDLMMPVMGGAQCLEEILKINSQARILLASGYSTDSSAEPGVRERAKGFVAKPYTVKALLETVRKALDAE